MSFVHKIEFEKDKLIDKSLKKINTKKDNVHFCQLPYSLFFSIKNTSSEANFFLSKSEHLMFSWIGTWQVRLRETNYQQVIFDKSFCGEL